MSVEIFKDGESHLVEPEHLESYLSNGYTLELDPMKSDKERELDLIAARELYKDKFGEEPHHKMKLETILEKLNGD